MSDKLFLTILGLLIVGFLAFDMWLVGNLMALTRIHQL